jgi:hypothetical protein
MSKSHPKMQAIAPNSSRWASELSSMLVSFINEVGPSTSDRVAVIVSVAAIDRNLEMLLRHFFIATSGATQEDCDFLLTQRPIPPLGSAGVRVRLARCLNLIEPQLAKAITFAIDCRNEFAHNPLPSPLTKAKAQALIDCCPRAFRVDNFLAEVTEKWPDGSSPRGTFVAVCCALAMILLLRADDFGAYVPGERR